MVFPSMGPRPNLVPHGLGNNDLQIDSSILVTSSEVDSEVGLDSGWGASSNQGGTEGMGSPMHATGDNDRSNDEADSSADVPTPKPQKHKKTPKNNMTVETQQNL